MGRPYNCIVISSQCLRGPFQRIEKKCQLDTINEIEEKAETKQGHIYKEFTCSGPQYLGIDYVEKNKSEKGDTIAYDECASVLRAGSCYGSA